MPSFPLPRSGVTMTPRTETTRPACPAPGNDSCIAANALLLPPVELSAMTPPSGKIHREKTAARPARHLPSCGAKRFRRPLLSPPLSPPRFAAHALHCRAFGAASVRRAPAPADLNLRPDRRLRARKRSSLIAALPNRVSAAENEITESRGRQEPTDSQHLCRSTSKHNDSVPAEESRRVRTSSPCPRRLSPGAGPGAADAAACSPPLRPAATQRELSPMRRAGRMFPRSFFMPLGIPGPKPPPEKRLRALHLAPRQADRHPPFRSLGTSTRRRGAQHAAPLLLPPSLFRPFVPASFRNLRSVETAQPRLCRKSVETTQLHRQRTRPSSDNKKAPSG